MNPDLLISEIFGLTIQGEGRQAGRLASFVRFGSCNLGCSWCDTPYAVFFDDRKANMHHLKRTYDPTKELHRESVQSILENVRKQGLPHGGLVVVSGGEPVLQDGGLYQLFLGLRRRKWEVAVETAGTLIPRSFIGSTRQPQWNVSPKLQNSGNSFYLRYKPNALAWFKQHGADFKFVCSSPKDLVEVEGIVGEIEIPGPRIWIMPEGSTEPKMLDTASKLFEAVVARRWNFTLRSHLLLPVRERGPQ